MRSRTLVLALLVACGGEEPTSTDLFQVDNVVITESGLNQVVLTGDITLLDGAGIGGSDGIATFYRDEYTATIGTAQSRIGLELADAGQTLPFELSTIQARLTPHEDGYLQICVDLQIDDSNYAEPTQVGCLDGEPEETTPTTTTPPAEEPPTVTINDPFELELFGLGETVDLDGRCTDPNQGNDTLDVSWTAELQGGTAGVFPLATDPIEGDGDTRGEWVDPPIGDYMIILSCTDDMGNEVSDSRNISVVDRQLSDLDGDGFTPATGDCNDADANTNPGAPEACDNIDRNCNTEVDDKDEDGDGHIDAACTNYAGLLPVDDCDDADGGINPDAAEACDNVDRDCSGTIDDKDIDGDGHIDESCTYYTGGLPVDDCEDANAYIYGGATETPGDGVDSDCDGYD